MCSSTIRFSCARFIMLSPRGTRHTSGNNVIMSTLIQRKNVQRWTPNVQCQLHDFLRNTAASDKDAPKSFHNFEHGALAVTRGSADQLGANGMNGLSGTNIK